MITMQRPALFIKRIKVELQAISFELLFRVQAINHLSSPIPWRVNLVAPDRFFEAAPCVSDRKENLTGIGFLSNQTSNTAPLLSVKALEQTTSGQTCGQQRAS